MTPLLRRIYSDYGMPSRLRTHEKLICAARDAGYLQTSIRDFLDRTRAGVSATSTFIVHRHDIDTDLRTTRKLFEMEKKYGVKASYYFRLSTLDFGLMREIEDYGSEASYHYEEVASFAKKNKIKDPALVRDRLPEIRHVFRKNFQWLEQQLGKKLRTVAGHGDFANRRLKVNNTEILADQQLREDCRVSAQAPRANRGPLRATLSCDRDKRSRRCTRCGIGSHLAHLRRRKSARTDSSCPSTG